MQSITRTPVGTTSPGAMHEQFSPQELQQTQHRFIQGDIYSPTDLSWEALRARRSQRKLMKDTFDMLGINPLTQYKVSRPATDSGITVGNQ